MGQMTEWGGVGRARRFMWKRWCGVLLVLVLAAGAVRGGGLLWHRLHELHWIEGDLQKGLAVAKRQNKKVLLLLSAHW